MSARLLFTADHSVETIEELSRVVLKRPVAAEETSRLVPAGASGTIVSELASGTAYLVEFTEPFAALVEVAADDVDAIAGERRDDLLARRLAHRSS